jgi:hypothetical protein
MSDTEETVHAILKRIIFYIHEQKILIVDDEKIHKMLWFMRDGFDIFIDRKKDSISIYAKPPDSLIYTWIYWIGSYLSNKRKAEVLAIIHDAVKMMEKKNKDYGNHIFKTSAVTVGEFIVTKITRGISILKSHGSPNFESLEDTLIDLINYMIVYLYFK